MATQPKVGARNDLDALKNARRLNNEASTKVESAIVELRRMQECAGRPDYTHISTIIANLSLDLAKSSKYLEEMWLLRQLAIRHNDDQLIDRIAYLEARMESLLYHKEIEDEPLFPNTLVYRPEARLNG